MSWFMAHGVVFRVIFSFFFSSYNSYKKGGSKILQHKLSVEVKKRRECGVDAFVVQYARHWILFSFGLARYRCRNGLDVLESVWELVIIRSTRFEYARVHPVFTSQHRSSVSRL